MADVKMERDGHMADVADNESVAIMEGLGWKRASRFEIIDEPAIGGFSIPPRAILPEPIAEQAPEAPKPARKRKAKA